MLGNGSHLKACPDLDSAIKTANYYQDLTYGAEKASWISACQIPCQQTSYNIKLRYFQETSMIDIIRNQTKSFNGFAVLLSFGYETMFIEEHVENLVYDIGSFLAAAGGNLGLFLGFSFLSVLLSLIKLLKKITTKKCSKISHGSIS